MNSYKRVKQDLQAATTTSNLHLDADNGGRHMPQNGGANAHTAPEPSRCIRSPGRVSLRDPPVPANASGDASQSSALFKTESGQDLTDELTQLLWLAYEQGHADISLIRKAFSHVDLTPEDLAGVYIALETAGFELTGASLTGAPSQAVAKESAQVEPQGSSGEELRQQVAEAQARPHVNETDILRELDEADHETRRILYAFGFAAHEHLVRAEKLLAHPTLQGLDELVADSKIPERGQYLAKLPGLINHVRALDHKAAAAWREWHQTQGDSRADDHHAEFLKFQRRLQRVLHEFCFQTKVIEEMVGFAQSIADRFRGSSRIIQTSQRSHESMWQMPLVDVERQCIAAMEELVRMPCDAFVWHCTQLESAQASFRHARAELIQAHLHLVSTIARSNANRGLDSAVLLRAGVVGLIHAVERFGFRPDWTFASYAACGIRQNIRDALAARRRHVPRPGPPRDRENHKCSDHPEPGEQDAARGSPLACEIGNAAP